MGRKDDPLKYGKLSDIARNAMLFATHTDDVQLKIETAARFFVPAMKAFPGRDEQIKIFYKGVLDALFAREAIKEKVDAFEKFWPAVKARAEGILAIKYFGPH